MFKKILIEAQSDSATDSVKNKMSVFLCVTGSVCVT